MANPSTHGTISAYANGCRCEPCRDAGKAFRAGVPADYKRHGTLTGYTHGCRCQDCKQAARDYRARKKKETP